MSLGYLESFLAGTVRLLLEHLADPEHAEHCTGSRTPLGLAAQHGHLDIVRFLLAVKGDKERASPKNLMTPLHLSAQNGYLEVVKLLLEKGADANKLSKSGRTALHLASASDHGCVGRTVVVLVVVL